MLYKFKTAFGTVNLDISKLSLVSTRIDEVNEDYMLIVIVDGNCLDYYMETEATLNHTAKELNESWGKFSLIQMKQYGIKNSN
jgi:hypothetical protein